MNLHLKRPFNCSHFHYIFLSYFQLSFEEKITGDQADVCIVTFIELFPFILLELHTVLGLELIFKHKAR